MPLSRCLGQRAGFAIPSDEGAFIRLIGPASLDFPVPPPTYTTPWDTTFAGGWLS